jgi:trimeric autotransporter adhesin
VARQIATTTNSTSRIDMAVGATVPWRTYTWCAIFNKTGTPGSNGRDYVWSTGNGTDDFGFRIVTANTLTIYMSSVVLTPSPSMPFGNTDGWVFVAVSSNATTAHRIDKYVYNTNTWTQSTATAGSVAAATANATFRIGNWNGSADAGLQGEIAALVQYNAQLSLSQLQSMAHDLNTWLFYQPVGMWVLDQSATTQSVVDLTGGGANQTSQTGTTIGTGSPPIGYGHALILPTRTAPPAAINAPAGQAAVTVAAFDATVAISGQAADAAVAADAQSATADLKPNATQAAVTVAAFDATTALASNANAGQADVAVAAQDATTAFGVPAGQAAVSADAHSATVDLKANAGQADVAAAGFDATVSTSSSINAPAADAAVAVAAQDATAALTLGVNASDAAVSVAAQDASAGLGAQPGQAAVTASAQDGTALLTANTTSADVGVAAFAATISLAAQAAPTQAAVTVAAFDAVVQTTGSTNAPADVAQADAAAWEATVAIATVSGQAAVAAAAFDASVSTQTQTSAPADQAGVAVAGFDATVIVTVNAGYGDVAATASAAAAMLAANAGQAVVDVVGWNPSNAIATQAFAQTAFVTVSAIQPPPPGTTNSPTGWISATNRRFVITDGTRQQVLISSNRQHVITSGGEHVDDI